MLPATHWEHLFKCLLIKSNNTLLFDNIFIHFLVMWASLLRHKSIISTFTTALTMSLEILGYVIYNFRHLFPLATIKEPRMCFHWSLLEMLTYPSSSRRPIKIKFILMSKMCFTSWRNNSMPVSNFRRTFSNINNFWYVTITHFNISKITRSLRSKEKSLRDVTWHEAPVSIAQSNHLVQGYQYLCHNWSGAHQ